MLVNLYARAKQLTPVGLRLTSLGFRSIMVFLLARFLPPSEVGLYGLLVATIGYAIYPLGFDFYTYSTREVIRGERGRWPTFLRSQLTFTLILYAAILPMLLLFFTTGILPWQLLAWLYVLIPLEHLGLELDRILIAMLDQLAASICIFLRQALAPLVAIPIIAFDSNLRTLEVFLAAWVFFDALGVALALVYVRRHLSGTPAGWVDWHWIWIGVKVSLPFLIGTLCLRALFTFDRISLQATTSLEVVAAYTLFMTVGNGLTSIVYSGVHQFIYPKLVRAAHDKDRRALGTALRAMLIRTLAVILLIAALTLALLPLLLAFTGHDTYRQYAWVMAWVLVVTGLYNLSLVPHFVLYALDEDRIILWLTVAALLTFVGTLALYLQKAPVLSVLVGLLLASSVLLAGKTAAAFVRMRKTLSAWSHAQ